jgi:anti-anti-sigma factor
MARWPDSSLSISTAEPREGVVVMSLVGELDVASSEEFGARVDELAKTSVSLVVDVSGLHFIDSSGLNALVTCGRAVQEGGGRLLVAGASEHIARVFEVVRLEESLQVFDTLTDAIAAVDAAAELDQVEE